jgi:hypothetical protein
MRPEPLALRATIYHVGQPDERVSDGEQGQEAADGEDQEEQGFGHTLRVLGEVDQDHDERHRAVSRVSSVF